MKYEIGNLWDYHERGAYIVIPTNMAVSSKGQAVMGAGLALQSKKRYPDLPEVYGQYLTKSKSHGVFLTTRGLILLPTKDRPQNSSSLCLIERGLKILRSSISTGRMQYVEQIALSHIGCGLGHLDWDSQVKPLVEKYLTDPRFVVVSPKGAI